MPNPTGSPLPSHDEARVIRRLPRWGMVAWLSLSAIALVAFRLHAFDVPLETDECNYAYIGTRLIEGDRLYVDVWDHQPPGVFMLFAAAIAVFGDAPEVFRWLACAASLASLGFVFSLARQFGGRVAACAASMMFALVSSDPGTAGDGVNREVFMNMLVLAAWWCALRAGWRFDGPGVIVTDDMAVPRDSVGVYAGRVRRSGQTITPYAAAWLFAAGLSLGLASTLKTVIAAHWLALLAWALAPWPADVEGRRSTPSNDGVGAHAPGVTRSASRHRRAWTIGLLAAGPALVWTAVIAYFALTGRLREFVDAVFAFNLGYSSGAGFLSKMAGFFTPERHPYIFDSALPLWLAGGVASLWVCVRVVTRRDRRDAAVLALLVAGYLATCLPGRFWPHYYHLVIPSLVLAVARTWSPARGVIPADAEREGVAAHGGGRHRLGPSLRFAVLAIVLAAVSHTQYRDYLSQPAFGVTVKRYNSRDFWGRAQGNNVARVTAPGDEVFVFGNDAAVYYYSRRKCASRYTMITGLMDGMRGADERRRILLDELRFRPPRLILVLFDQPPFPGWQAFLREHYGEPIGWDFHDQSREAIMFVLARKDAPVETIDWDWDRATVGGWIPGS